GFDEQRSDLALFEGLRKEDEDSCNSEDDESTATAVASAAAAAATAAADAGVEEAFPEGPSPPANRPATWLAHHDHDVQLVGAGSDNGIVARRRRRRRRRRQEEPRLSQQEGRAANLDYARNLHQKDPGLPPLRVLRESGRGALRLAHMALGNPHVMALMHSLDHLRSLTSIDVADNRIGSAAIQTVVSVAEEKGVTHLDLSWNHVDRPSADMISAYLARSGSLSSLVLKSSGVSDVAGAKMMAAVADNTTLKILDLSGNNIGGTSDLLATHHLHEQGVCLSAASSAGGSGAAGEGGRLTGGAAIAMALDTNYSLTHLDLGWNKIGGTNAAIIGSAIENNQELRWLGLAGNRVGDEGAFSLAKALGVNYTLAHLDVSFNGISREGAAALAHGLAENASVENIQVDSSTSTSPNPAKEPPHGRPFSQLATEQGAVWRSVLELVRPSPDAPILQPRGDTTTASLGDDPVKFCARTWPDQRAAMEDLLLRTDGDREPWRLPPAGRLAGSVDFQPLPPCAAIMCNASGLQGILRAMGGCTETRGEAFRLFATDLFFTTDQVQWLIEQFAEGPSPLNNAEVLEMMAAVAPQIYDNAGLPDLIERNLSPMGRRLLVAQLGQAYPAFTGGVSGPFVLDLRFPAHRLAAVRLAEAENIQQRLVRRWMGAMVTKREKGANKRRRRTNKVVIARKKLHHPQIHWGYGAASGLRDKPNGVLQLDFVCTSRPPEGTQPISDLELARLLNSCGMLDPNYWSEYLRPTNFPVSFVDLIRLLRVKGRGDRRQAKLLVLLLRVKNSMWRTARDEIKREGKRTNQSRRWRIGRVLSAHRGPTSTQRGTSTIVSAAMANLAARIGGNAVSSSTAVTPSAITSTINPSSSKHSRKSKALGASQRLSTMHRVIKSFPNSRSNSGSERTLDGDGEVAGGGGAAVVATDNELGAEHEEQELTPVQAAVVATDKRLEDLLNAGGILRAQGRRTRLHVFPPRTPAWGEKDGVTGIGVKTSLGGIGRAGADVSDDFRSVGASASVCALGIDDDDDSGGGGDGVAEMEERAVVDWARRFCEPECEFPAYETEDGFRLGRALARHVVRDRDAGLLGTRRETVLPPTLLVHGLCIRVKHRESGRVLRVKHRSTTGSNRNRMDADKPSRHQDEWAAVVRQGVRGSHLRVGTKKEVASALAAIFASQIQERYRTRTSSSINVTPRTLGTLNMSEDEEWRDVFVPSDLYASTSPEESGSLHLRLLVVNTSVEPDLSRSLAQLRARLGGCWLSSAQATSVASVVPRVLGGTHYRIDAVAFLFSRVVDLHNYRQVMETLHENKRPQLSPRLGDLDALCPAAA
ncbi:unnamed protein product, partial [Pylaiella littoralis]